SLNVKRREPRTSSLSPYDVTVTLSPLNSLTTRFTLSFLLGTDVTTRSQLPWSAFASFLSGSSPTFLPWAGARPTSPRSPTIAHVSITQRNIEILLRIGLTRPECGLTSQLGAAHSGAIFARRRASVKRLPPGVTGARREVVARGRQGLGVAGAGVSRIVTGW